MNQITIAVLVEEYEKGAQYFPDKKATGPASAGQCADAVRKVIDINSGHILFG